MVHDAQPPSVFRTAHNAQAVGMARRIERHAHRAGTAVVLAALNGPPKVRYPAVAVWADAVGAPAVHGIRRSCCRYRQQMHRRGAKRQDAPTLMTAHDRALHCGAAEEVAGAGVDAALPRDIAATANAAPVRHPAAPSRQARSCAVRVVLVVAFALVAPLPIEAGLAAANAPAHKSPTHSCRMVIAVGRNRARNRRA